MSQRSKADRSARLDAARSLHEKLARIAQDLTSPEVVAYFDDVDRGFDREILATVIKDPEKARQIAFKRDAFRDVRALITSSPKTLEAIDRRLAELNKDSSNGE